MNEEASHPSHALRWTLGVLTALLLYVLSFGPIVGLAARGTIPIRVAKRLHVFYQPVFWLIVNTPLQEPLILYNDWWCGILAKP